MTALKRNGVVLVDTVEIAAGFRERCRGLLGRSSLGRGRALYLPSCSCIHTFFMKFSLDLVFVNRRMEVRKVARNVRPNRMVWGGPGTWAVLEMESGWLPPDRPARGDKLDLS